MKAAIRYYSRGGNVKAMAEAISRGTGLEAISIDDPRAPITEPIDLLFIGGALYNFKLDKKLNDYLRALPEGMVAEAVAFGSSMLTRRPLFIIQDRLKEKNIKLNQQAVWSRNRPNDNLLEAIEYFAKNEMVRDRSLDGLPPYLIFQRSQEIKAAKEAAAAEGREYIAPDDPDYDAKVHAHELAEAQAEVEEAEAAAREAELAAQAALEQAAAAKAIAEEKARAAAELSASTPAEDEPDSAE